MVGRMRSHAGRWHGHGQHVILDPDGGHPAIPAGSARTRCRCEMTR